MNDNQLIIFCDGAARGNPGPAAAGFVVKCGDRSESYGFSLGKLSNNVAEYAGVIAALKWLTKSNQKVLNEVRQCLIYLDSELVVKQLNNLYRVKDKKLQSLVAEVKELEKQLPLLITYRHVLRHHNQDADQIVNLTLDLTASSEKASAAGRDESE